MLGDENRIDLWERRAERLFAALPYAMLTVSTVLAAVRPDQTAAHRLGTIGLAVLAALWLWWIPSANPQWSSRQPPMIVYFAGLLVLVSVLLTRDDFFTAFAVTAYLQPFGLLPIGWALGVVATSAVVVNTVPKGLPGPTTLAWAGYFGNIVVNTLLACSLGLFLWVVSEQGERRKRALTEVAAANRRAGVLAERARMAGEIHDTLAQGLTGIITQLEAAEETRDWRHVGHATELARHSLTEARRSVRAVEPEPLRDARLPDALAQVAADWARLHRVDARVTTTGEVRPMHTGIEVALLRTAQEALANVARHARASRVVLTLSYMDDVVTLDVRDDGVGFDLGAAPRAGAFGLVGMRQRIRKLAGRLAVESEPGGGTAVSATVPAIEAGAVG